MQGLDRRRLLIAALICWGIGLLAAALACRGDELRVGGMASATRSFGYVDAIWGCNPRCAEFGSSRVLPDMETALCYQRAAVAYLRQRVLDGAILFDPATRPYASQAEAAASLRPPQVMFAECPHYGTWYIGLTTWTGCAAGIAYGPSILVSLSDQARVLPLVAWESGNSVVTWQLGRSDLGDGAEVSAATNHAISTCGTALSRPLATP